MADDYLKTLSSSTPDGTIKSGDAVICNLEKSKYGQKMESENGDNVYYFDTYDSLDDTCFIAPKRKYIPKKAHKKMSTFCYWVDLKDIELKE